MAWANFDRNSGTFTEAQSDELNVSISEIDDMISKFEAKDLAYKIKNIRPINLTNVIRSNSWLVGHLASINCSWAIGDNPQIKNLSLTFPIQTMACTEDGKQFTVKIETNGDITIVGDIDEEYKGKTIYINARQII